MLGYRGHFATKSTDIAKKARDLLTAMKIDAPRKICELTTPQG